MISRKISSSLKDLIDSAISLHAWDMMFRCNDGKSKSASSVIDQPFLLGSLIKGQISRPHFLTLKKLFPNDLSPLTVQRTRWVLRNVVIDHTDRQGCCLTAVWLTSAQGMLSGEKALSPVLIVEEKRGRKKHKTAVVSAAEKFDPVLRWSGWPRACAPYLSIKDEKATTRGKLSRGRHGAATRMALCSSGALRARGARDGRGMRARSEKKWEDGEMRR